MTLADSVVAVARRFTGAVKGEARNGIADDDDDDDEDEALRGWKGEESEILERTGVGKAENMRWKSEDEGASMAPVVRRGVDGMALERCGVEPSVALRAGAAAAAAAALAWACSIRLSMSSAAAPSYHACVKCELLATRNATSDNRHQGRNECYVA
jgi:hypothetical protein